MLVVGEYNMTHHPLFTPAQRYTVQMGFLSENICDSQGQVTLEPSSPFHLKMFMMQPVVASRPHT